VSRGGECPLTQRTHQAIIEAALSAATFGRGHQVRLARAGLAVLGLLWWRGIPRRPCADSALGGLDQAAAWGGSTANPQAIPRGIHGDGGGGKTIAG
jgi:hypothetical protein